MPEETFPQTFFDNPTIEKSLENELRTIVLLNRNQSFESAMQEKEEPINPFVSNAPFLILLQWSNRKCHLSTKLWKPCSWFKHFLCWFYLVACPKPCLNQGKCNARGKCECSGSYEGEQCQNKRWGNVNFSQKKKSR